MMAFIFSSLIIFASFSPDMISSSLSPNPRWSISEPLPIEVPSILSQKFTLLGSGDDAFVFQSEDKRYVLKFFKMRHLMPSLLDRLCPHVARKRLRKFNLVFSGYRNGFQELRQETGLIWIHLAKTNTLNQTITVVDRDGKEYRIDADSTEFVIQEKAELLFDYLSRLYGEGKQMEAKRAIDSFYAFIQHRTDKGYMDRDHAIAQNYGFVDDHPIQIDLGRLYRRRNRKNRPTDGQLELVQKRIENWKSEHH